MSEVDFLIGQTINEIRYYAEGTFRLVFDAGDRVEPRLYADLGPFSYVDPTGATHGILPDSPATVAPALMALGRRIDAVKLEDGVLTLMLSDASQVRCEPHDLYEAWQVVGGFPQHLVVCVPGGELAVVDDQSRSETLRFDHRRGE
jgi:hypothetical protein